MKVDAWANRHAPPKCAARHALYRCSWVAYARELNTYEQRGMRALEVTGETDRDESGLDLHWHQRVDR